MPTAPLVTVLLAVHDGEALPRYGGRERPRPDRRRSRASRRRRRVDRSHAGDTRGGRGRAAARHPQRRAARPRRLAEPRARRGARAHTSHGSTPTTSRCPGDSSVSSLASARVPASACSDRRSWRSTTADRVGRLHQMPTGAGAVRWAALFSSPFFHPSVLVDRDLLERNGLRYDTSFEESEDYELWSRLLDVADGDNLPDPLVLYRVHAAQASQRRRELQRECQLRVARRRIAAARARALGRRGGAGVACRQRRRDRSRRVRSSRRRVSRTACRLRATSTGQAPAHRLPVTSRAWRRMRLRDRVRV